MNQPCLTPVAWIAIGLLGFAGLVGGCERLTVRGQGANLSGYPTPPVGVTPWVSAVPSEKQKTSLPTYVIEPPDILLIDAVKVIPKAPYHIEPLDTLQILVIGALPDQPITGQYAVDPNGEVELGPAYGSVRVAGLSIEEAQELISKNLNLILNGPEVSVSLAQASGQQQVAGDHLVGPDGTVNLGNYGTVYVAGMTLDEAERAIIDQLALTLDDPRIAVDILAYNSKVYYVIAEGAGFGDSVTRVPVTGNETVLDALAQVNGMNRLSSRNVWIARPAPGGIGCDQILTVNWSEITKGAASATNYQVLPGDRVFVAEDKLLRADTMLARVLDPVQRVFGTSLLSVNTLQTINRYPNGYTGGIP